MHDDNADVRSELLDAKAALGRIRHALDLDKVIPMTAFGYQEIATATIQALADLEERNRCQAESIVGQQEVHRDARMRMLRGLSRALRDLPEATRGEIIEMCRGQFLSE